VTAPLTPAAVCHQLLAALEASDGRRRRRKRDTTPDAIGMELRRELLEAAVRDDPAADDFEGWLVGRCAAADASGPLRAMAAALLAEWRLALDSSAFRGWLAEGAPSDDRISASPESHPPTARE
jgi:hypothetical protein